MLLQRSYQRASEQSGRLFGPSSAFCSLASIRCADQTSSVAPYIWVSSGAARSKDDEVARATQQHTMAEAQQPSQWNPLVLKLAFANVEVEAGVMLPYLKHLVQKSTQGALRLSHLFTSDG